MDNPLLAERNRFKQKQLLNAVVHTTKRATSDDSGSSQAKKTRTSSEMKMRKAAVRSGPPSGNLTALAKIVTLLEKRHKGGDRHPLNFEDLLEEARLCGDKAIRQSAKTWLLSEGLPNNPSIRTRIDEEKNEKCYCYNPPYVIEKISNITALANDFQARLKGGIPEEKILKSCPTPDDRAKRILVDLAAAAKILLIKRSDRKHTIFAETKTWNFSVNEKVRGYWKSIQMDGITDQELKERLEVNQIKSVKSGLEGSGFAVGKKELRQRKPRRNRFRRVHNSHINLKTYDRDTLGGSKT